jgi:hypothetical protein
MDLRSSPPVARIGDVDARVRPLIAWLCDWLCISGIAASVPGGRSKPIASVRFAALALLVVPALEEVPLRGPAGASIERINR